MSRADASRRRLVPPAGEERSPAAIAAPGRGQVSAWVLVGLSIIGLGLAAYLTSVHYAPGILVCSSQGIVDCAKVLSSQFSVIPGTQLPITIPGMAYFVVSLLLAVAQLRRPLDQGLRRAHCAWGIVGILTVFYLVYVELLQLRTICLWCSSVHLVILLTLLVTLWRLNASTDTSPRSRR
ncbi:MAG: vitamin K epoxide reductase family protein [Candidatus Dormibacteria bacterium]